jgi:hypothetical protein
VKVIHVCPSMSKVKLGQAERVPMIPLAEMKQLQSILEIKRVKFSESLMANEDEDIDELIDQISCEEWIKKILKVCL